MHLWATDKDDPTEEPRYHDTMIDHIKNVGDVLDYLDKLGIADSTFVMYSTDNGPHINSWPDGGMTPFRSEKNTNWEGAFRVPMLVRWPGHIKAGSVANGIVQHHDWLPTFLAMAGDPDIVEKLKKGAYAAVGRRFKNHIDGYNLVPCLTGEVKSPRQLFMYFSDDGMCSVCATTLENSFHGAALSGRLAGVGEPFVPVRLPKIFNLRTDPFERRHNL
jgi:arylsulfatase A-like enzyme